MDEFNELDYFSNKSYNQNNFKFSKKFSLNNSVKFNNYINPENSEFKNDQVINNNINNQKESINLIQIKKDLDSLNNKMNILTNALYNFGIFNFSSKKKINLKKSSSMNSKQINNNKNNIKNFINKSMCENIENNKGGGNTFMNGKQNNNINFSINKRINRNIDESYNYINNNEYFDYFHNNPNYCSNIYFSNSMNITKPKNNKKIQNIKLSRNNSISGIYSNKNNKYTLDKTININSLELDNNPQKKKNIIKNPYFGIYDRYFLESLTNNNPKKEGKNDNSINNNNHQNIKDRILNQSKKININKNIYNNGDNVKKNLIFYDFKNKNNSNSINFNNNDCNNEKNVDNIHKNVNNNNKNSNELPLKKIPKSFLIKKQLLSNKLNIQNKKKKLINNENENNKIKNDDIIQKQNSNQIILNEEKLCNNQSEKQSDKMNKNKEKIFKEQKKIKNNTNRKNLSFHEENNITIEYDPKEEITKINVFDFFGENQNFQPRNVNVILEKLKRKKIKSILLNKNIKNNLKDNDGINESNESRKIKKLNSFNSIFSNKEKMLLNKYKLKKRKSNSLNKNYAKRRNKVCEKFLNNPQLFYSDELCDLIIESFDIDGEYRRKKRIESRNIKNNSYFNNISDKEENMTDIEINIRPKKFLQTIIEENI